MSLENGLSSKARHYHAPVNIHLYILIDIYYMEG